MPVGEVVGDSDDPLVLQFFGGIVGERIGALCRCRGEANKPRARVPLRHVLCRGNAKRRHLLFREIISDRQCFESSERSNDAMHIVLFDQLLRLGPCGCRDAGGIGDDQFDLTPSERVLARLEKHCQRKVHIDAAGRQRAGLGREQADADRFATLGREEMRGR